MNNPQTGACSLLRDRAHRDSGGMFHHVHEGSRCFRQAAKFARSGRSQGCVCDAKDRDKGVVTLGGHVATDSGKSQAESIARSIAGSQVVANQIAVLPGVESDAKT